MICKQCGAEVPEEASHCGSCGEKVAPSEFQPVSGIPEPTIKSGGARSVLLAVVSVLVVALVALAVTGMFLGWYGPRPESADQGQTGTTGPSQGEPAVDPSLQQWQWEGMTVYLPKQMYELRWCVDYMEYYDDEDRSVRITSYEITKNMPVKRFASYVAEGLEGVVELSELSSKNDVFYSQGTGVDGAYRYVIGFFASNDRGYAVMVCYPASDAPEEEMVQIATTAKMDANVVPAVLEEGYSVYSTTKTPIVQGLMLHLSAGVKLTGYYMDGTVGYWNDSYDLEIYPGTVSEDWYEVYTAQEMVEYYKTDLELTGVEVRTGVVDGVPYLEYQDADGFNCVIACYVEGDQWWEVMAYRYSWSASADDMIKAVTSGEMTSSM